MGKFSKHIEHITKDAIRKNGFATPQIIYDWNIIVGEYLAKYTTPIKISFPKNKNSDGVLHIEVISAQAPIIQQLESEIISKIATYFGYKAVGKIRLVQTGSLPPEEKMQQKQRIDAVQQNKLDKMLDGVKDSELKELLKSIGENIYERQQKQ